MPPLPYSIGTGQPCILLLPVIGAFHAIPLACFYQCAPQEGKKVAQSKRCPGKELLAARTPRNKPGYGWSLCRSNRGSPEALGTIKTGLGMGRKSVKVDGRCPENKIGCDDIGKKSIGIIPGQGTAEGRGSASPAPAAGADAGCTQGAEMAGDTTCVCTLGKKMCHDIRRSLRTRTCGKKQNLRHG